MYGEAFRLFHVGVGFHADPPSGCLMRTFDGMDTLDVRVQHVVAPTSCVRRTLNRPYV